MKAKKARRRLQEVDGLLAEVIEGYTSNGTGVRELLSPAQKAVADAIASLEKPGKKAPSSARTPEGRRVTAGSRKRVSAAAKSRAIARGKDVYAATRPGLHRTA